MVASQCELEDSFVFNMRRNQLGPQLVASVAQVQAIFDEQLAAWKLVIPEHWLPDINETLSIVGSAIRCNELVGRFHSVGQLPAVDARLDRDECKLRLGKLLVNQLNQTAKVAFYLLRRFPVGHVVVTCIEDDDTRAMLQHHLWSVISAICYVRTAETVVGGLLIGKKLWKIPITNT